MDKSAFSPAEDDHATRGLTRRCDEDGYVLAVQATLGETPVLLSPEFARQVLVAQGRAVPASLEAAAKPRTSE
jgi:hypothetical protein